MNEHDQREIAADAARLGIRPAAEKYGVSVASVSRWCAAYGQAEKALALAAAETERMNVRRERLLERLSDAVEAAAEVANSALERAAKKDTPARDVVDLTKAAVMAIDRAAAVVSKVHTADWTPPVPQLSQGDDTMNTPVLLAVPKED